MFLLLFLLLFKLYLFFHSNLCCCFALNIQEPFLFILLNFLLLSINLSNLLLYFEKSIQILFSQIPLNLILFLGAKNPLLFLILFFGSFDSLPNLYLIVLLIQSNYLHIIRAGHLFNFLISGSPEILGFISKG